MATQGQAQKDLGFNAIYFDTEPLTRSNWPHLPVLLSNIFDLANVWGLELLLPEPVERQREQQWLRDVRERHAKLNAAARELDKFTSAVRAETKVEYESVDKLLAPYRDTVAFVKNRFKIQTIPFSTRPITEIYDLAIRYILPFETKGQGKGFQDAVILASVLDDLATHRGRSGVLISADNVLSRTDFKSFWQEAPTDRLTFLTLYQLWEALYDKYWQENVKAPWQEERENARAAVQALEADLRTFIQNNLTESLLTLDAHQRLLQVRDVDEVEVQYTQTPIPDPAKPDRSVKFAVAVLARGQILIEEQESPLFLLVRQKFVSRSVQPKAPEQLDRDLFWIGGVECDADVVGRQFRNVRFLSLVPSKELGEGKWFNVSTTEPEADK